MGPTSPRPRQVPPCVVLLVDDSPVARLAVARRLRSEGFEVVEQASAAPPDGTTLSRIACALLDLDLGGKDGADLAQGLLSGRAGLPIAFFSGSSSGELLARARALGPVFAKPGELEAAIAWVRDASG
jgi:DNA-binding response OmpR family regulator